MHSANPASPSSSFRSVNTIWTTTIRASLLPQPASYFPRRISNLLRGRIAQHVHKRRTPSKDGQIVVLIHELIVGVSSFAQCSTALKTYDAAMRQLGSLGSAVSRFTLPLPAANLKRNSSTRRTQFIRKRAINHGPRDNHPTDSHRGNALRCNPALTAILNQAAFQHAHHRSENRLESKLRTRATARNIGRQRHHRTRILHILKVLPGQIGAHNLRPNICRRKIYVHTLPAVLPLRVGKEAPQHLSIEIALALEIAIESTVRQPRSSHDLAQRNTFKTISIE